MLNNPIIHHHGGNHDPNQEAGAEKSSAEESRSEKSGSKETGCEESGAEEGSEACSEEAGSDKEGGAEKARREKARKEEIIRADKPLPAQAAFFGTRLARFWSRFQAHAGDGGGIPLISVFRFRIIG
jgi:hypothetical protein